MARLKISIVLVCAFFCVLLIPAKDSFACTDLPVRIAGANPVCYATLQDAYDVALDNAVIQSKNITLYQKLNANRNINVTLQGGYNSDYSAVDGFTYVKGSITTSAGAGTVTAGNFQTSAGPVVAITSPLPGLTNITTAQLTYMVNDGLVKVYLNNNLISKVSGDTLGPLTPDGTYVVRIDSTDLQGTVGSASVTLTIDTTPPSASFTINNGAAYTNNTSVALNVSASDANGVRMQFSNDNSNWSNMTPFTQTVSWALPAGDGAKTVYAKFKDYAGNWYPAQSNSTIILDTVTPSTAFTPQGGMYNAPLNVELAPSETATIHYTTDGTSPTTSSPVYSGPINIANNATTTLKFFAQDAAGNTENVKTAVYTIDTAAPTGTITINNHAKLTNKATVILNLNATDTNGVSEMQFSNDNNSWSTPMPYAASANWTLTSSNGMKTVYAKFKDTVGNWSVQEVATIFLSDPLKKMQAGLSQIAAGSFHNLYLSRDGVLEGWGSNLYGEVGDGTAENKPGPVRIMTAPTQTWIGITGGMHHSIGLKSDGSLWGWGINNRYQLTQMINTDEQLTPAKSGTDTDWIFASAGMNHTMGIKTNGSLWGWGDNPAGQVGNNSTDRQPIPVRIGADTDHWVLVSAGGSHTAAIKSDETLWVWGFNNNGQIGDGTAQKRLSPFKIETDNGHWVTTSAGGYHTAAIKSDGTLWTWGDNIHGQLGDGTETDQKSPIKIGTDNDRWVDVSAGKYHTAAIKSDGTLWTWGYNNNGQLGDGTNTNRTTPFKIDTATDWVAVDAGDYHTIAFKSDGSVWTWGLNSSGQVGDGTLVSRITPTLILSGSSSSSSNDPDAFNVYCNGTEKYIVGESTFTSGMILPPAGSNGILIDLPLEGSTISGSKTIIKGSIDTTIPVNKVVVQVISNVSGSNSYVAQVNANYFAAKIILAEGANTVTAISYDKNGGQHQMTISINATAQTEGVSLVATPGSGIPTTKENGQSGLDVILTAEPTLLSAPTSYIWDFIGSGSDQLKCFTHSIAAVEYQQPSLYLTQVTATDTVGNTYSDTVIINVLDVAQMNAILKPIWSDIKIALANDNIAAALNGISENAKATYQSNFELLRDYLPQIAQDMGDITLKRMEENTAEMELLMTQDGVLRSYYLEFKRAEDGSWKLNFF